MFLSSLAQSVPTPADDKAWYDVIGKFKAYAAEFQSWFNRLASYDVNAHDYPDITAERNDLLDRGRYIREKIQSITNSIDTAWNWLKTKFLSHADYDPAQYEGVAGLGFIPLIPIAVVAGSATLIGKWIFDAKKLSAKIEEIKRLEARGMSPAQAHAIVTKTIGNGALINFGQSTTLLILGGIGVLAYLYHNRGK